MSTLTVWKFNTADGAEKALSKLEGLQKQQLIQVMDAAIVTWEQGRSRPKTYQAFNTVGIGALGGAFWGMLFGLIFLCRCLAYWWAQQQAQSQANLRTTVSMTISLKTCGAKSPKELLRYSCSRVR